MKQQTNQITIPRPLPLPINDELSMLFSHHFVSTIKSDPIYQELNRSSRLLQSSGVSYLRMIPNEFTPQTIFRKPLDHATKDILTNSSEINWHKRISLFLQHLYKTPIFFSVYERLHARNLFPGSLLDFQGYFESIWFGDVVRENSRTMNSSCGFHHVYIGEQKKNLVKGLHNWIRYYILEKTGTIQMERLHNIHPTHSIAALRFRWNEAIKLYGTIYFGIPIDFEIMIFFCAFISRQRRDTIFLIDGTKITTTTCNPLDGSNRLVTAYFRSD